MPVVEDPGRARGRVLVDGSGEAIGRFDLGERDGQPLADLFAPAPGVSPERAVAAVMSELKGWRVASEAPFGRLLAIAGARPLRHSHAMSRDLVRDPAPAEWLEPARPAGVRLTPVDRPAIDLAPACLAAYPRDHPDFADIPTPERPEIELDELMSGRLLGPLLRLPAVGLAVTHSNPAMAVYAALGFVDVLDALNVEV